MATWRTFPSKGLIPGAFKQVISSIAAGFTVKNPRGNVEQAPSPALLRNSRGRLFYSFSSSGVANTAMMV
jgi:hypothetical protein